MCTNEEKHTNAKHPLRKPFEQLKLALRSQNLAFRVQFSVCDPILADKDSSLHAFKLLLTTFWIYFLFFFKMEDFGISESVLAVQRASLRNCLYVYNLTHFLVRFASKMLQI